MAKKENDATASEKILDLYNLLLFSTRSYSHTELARKLNCSKSSITRYILIFENMFPEMLVKEKQGNSILYRFVNSQSYRASINLSTSELELLEMAKHFTSPLPESQKQSLNFALEKIINTFKTPLNENDCINCDLPVFNSLKGKIQYKHSHEVLTKVMKAIKAKRVCIVESIYGKKSEVAFTQLLINNDALYAQGYFVTEMGKPEIVDSVSFYIHRMKDVIITQRKHGFKESDTSKKFGILQTEPIKAKIQFRGYAIPYVKDRIYSDDQQFTDLEDGTTILSLTASNQYELISFVQSFGSSATLLSPEYLREELKADLENSLENYK